MSFPRYPEYKASGVEWLGDVPGHWESWKLSHSYKTISSGTTPKSDNAIYYENGDIPWVNTGDLNDSVLDEPSKRLTYKALEDHTSLKLYPCGSIIFAMYGATIGKIAKLNFEATVNQACCVFTESNILLNDFLKYWFLGVRNHILSLATGGGQPNVSQDILRNLRVVCPSISEQQAIADFLDRETAKIDGLIEEQRRLVELLKEKRQAVISHAVTKGLNPNAPMKPSGIEWLGDIPEHWTLEAVAYRYNVKLGKMLDTNKITGENLRNYLRVLDVQWGYINTIDLPEMDFDSEAREKFRLIEGDLLVNEGGSYPGRAAIWSCQIEECYYQKALHRMRPILANKDSSKFMYYIMNWASNYGVFIAGGNEATIEHLPAEKLRRIRFAFPPICEQLIISSYLDRKTTEFDTLISEAEKSITLLQERRTALISAAVTGKIDVRGLSGVGED